MSTTADLVTMAGGEADHVFAIGDVPPKQPYPYRVIGFAVAPPVVRTQDQSGDPVRRFTVQHFSRTADAVEEIAAATLATFDGKTVDGDVCSLEVATLPDRDQDDRGVLSTTHTYRY